MKYKLLAVDLDGTLLNDNKEISAENYKAMQYAIEKGVIVVPCTGRAIQGITKFSFPPQKTFNAVAYNGGMVVDVNNDKTIYHCPLNKEDVQYIISKGMEYRTNICVWVDNKLYCNVINDYTLSYSKISSVPPIKFDDVSFFDDKTVTKVLWHDDENRIAHFLNIMSKQVSENVCCCTSKPWFLELFNSATSKALALDTICKGFNISPKEVIAFGDELNDINMIEFAGMGVAMGNARAEVKAVANYITASNNDNGFAQAVYKLVR